MFYFFSSFNNEGKMCYFEVFGFVGGFWLMRN